MSMYPNADADAFADFVEGERARINESRDALLTERLDIEQRLAQLDREMQAVDAYITTKAGKLPAAARPRSRTPRSNGAARPGSRRKDIVDALHAHPGGLARGELIQVLGAKGDKSGEMAISNALTALIKNATLTRNDEHKYTLAA